MLLLGRSPSKIFTWKYGTAQRLLRLLSLYVGGGTGIVRYNASFLAPAAQTQSGVNSPEHLARYGLLTAQPVEIAASDEAHGGIQFNFANAFSIVEPAAEDDCRLSDRERPAEADPTRRRVGNLAIPAGTIDLTVPIGSDPELPVTVEEESRRLYSGSTDRSKWVRRSMSVPICWWLPEAMPPGVCAWS